MEFSLAELGGTPLPPLAENHPAQKPLAELGGTPPPLGGKNPLSSFWRAPWDRYLLLDLPCKEKLDHGTAYQAL